MVSIGAAAGWVCQAEARQPQVLFVYCIFVDPPPPPPPVLPGDDALPVLLGSLGGAVAFLLLRAAFGVLARVESIERSCAAVGDALTGADNRETGAP